MSAKFAVMSGGERMVRITISGHPGSGTSTLVGGISSSLSWSSLNGGAIFREEAKNRNLTLTEFEELCAKDFTVDRSLDDILKSRMEDVDGPEVIESRLAGWWAHLLEIDCVRLWIEVNESVRAERVVEREGISFEKALSDNSKRINLDLERFDQMYGLSPEDTTPYTHVIDASGLTIEEVLEAALKILEEVE
jgi:cytidylate kinase